VICLDTNYLVRGLVRGTRESDKLIRWHQVGEVLSSAAPAWYEFLCGPVAQPQIRVMGAFLSGGVISFEEVQAIEAARLFNVVGRVRRVRIDAMIAATAILADARLATSNKDDFKMFVPHGLKLVG
jgi:predicted nucleic acid-binding protein